MRTLAGDRAILAKDGRLQASRPQIDAKKVGALPRHGDLALPPSPPDTNMTVVIAARCGRRQGIIVGGTMFAVVAINTEPAAGTRAGGRSSWQIGRASCRER